MKAYSRNRNRSQPTPNQNLSQKQSELPLIVDQSKYYDLISMNKNRATLHGDLIFTKSRIPEGKFVTTYFTLGRFSNSATMTVCHEKSTFAPSLAK